MLSGSCLCGAVAYEIDADLPGAITCHCRQCRKQSGHVFSAVPAPREALRMIREDALRWYRHTDIATRGFCAHCGSSLFWRGDGDNVIMVAMGALDGSTGLRLEGHYWTGFKGDYYAITDGLPQYQEGSA